MDNEKNQTDFLSMVADRAEARIANEKRIEALRQNDSIDYRAAVELTAERLKSIQKTESSAIGSNFFEGLLNYSEYLSWPPTDVEIAELIEESLTNFKAFKVLELLDQLPKGPEHFPSFQRWKNEKYLGLYQPPRKPSGTPAFVNVHRDTLIAGAIKSLVGRGFLPTRQKGKPGKSACDVVVEALSSIGLNLSYDAIESIWARREKLQTPALLIEGLEEILGMSLS